MVVISGSWVKNVATYPTPANNSDMVISTPNNNMTAKAILICRPNSHPFLERTLTLDQPVKVGRSVARARATPTNAIFDCKVLSRHHALLWYDCGKFYLQDTNSSNGTFVNNNRLSSSESEPHEVCSGDIVQFGVDVVENNRKVTHGCIVATLKLYLPDGKEAKASPSITETSRHGVVALDEIYKLGQIIQEASQREQCLENKLTALQRIVEETKRSADESWQAYVGEERLLSRVATLENQLTQAGKSWGDDRLREELTKLQEERSAYQAAAKEALSKLHSELLKAEATAADQQRATASVEFEATLAKKQLAQAQQELQDVAQKLTEEQNRSEEEKSLLEQRERELQDRLVAEAQTINELKAKLESFQTTVNNPVKELLPLEELEKCSLIFNDDDDVKSKEEFLTENDNCDLVESNCNRSNNFIEPQEKHINLMVVPVTDSEHDSDSTTIDTDDDDIIDQELRNPSTITLTRENTIVEDNAGEEREKECNEKERKSAVDEHVESAKDIEILQTQGAPDVQKKEISETDKESTGTDNVDCKTLKYQFQSVQNEMRKQIEQLQQLSVVNKTKLAQLEASLCFEKELSSERAREAETLKAELVLIEQKWKESCNESQQLRDKVSSLTEELESVEQNLKTVKEVNDKLEASLKSAKTVPVGNGKSRESSEFNQNHIDNSITELNQSISSLSVSSEQVLALEEELVLLKERFAHVNDEKLMIKKKFASVCDEYNALRNRSYNTLFFYIAPLVVMILYLLFTNMFS